MSDILQDINFSEENITFRVYLDFRIRSDQLNPKEITEHLGINPSRAWAKGEEHLSKRRDPITKEMQQVWLKYPWGMWTISTEGLAIPKQVEKHILYLIDLLEPRKDKLDRYLLQKTEYSISTYIWWEPFEGHGTYEISSETLLRISALSHYIEFGFISKGAESEN
jgi:hypothetical protein